ncbi:MAG: 50S ribosomal protein L11 methyltransferase [Labilithrix sp.]|nr:50S ribosomal protein L11 methyltransferase [Labilithrix sp.]
MTQLRIRLVPVVLLVVAGGCSRTPPVDPPATSAAPSSPAPAAASASASATASVTAPQDPPPPASAAADDEPPTRVPDIEYVPTPQNVVDKLLDAAKIKKDDVLYDLGCGDGRIVVTAAKKFGVKAIGFDIDPKRVEESNANVKKNKVEHLVTIMHKDIFTVDLSPASVVTLYLLPELNVRLIPQLEKLKAGSRVVSHDFDMEGVDPVNTWTVMAPDHRPPHKDREHYVYLWNVPLKKLAPKK